VSDVAIRAEGLGKRYRLGQGHSYRALRDTISDVVTRPFRRRSASRAGRSFIWALKDVSFEVRQGEVLGVIGRNGAGKSTLLKVLSRITKPTTGRAEIHGRVGSLLEVGTGFHPELTGRENLYLNGSILGMSKREIDAKFDEIVAFAEVERFIDTPVKHYSSGMHVRLAFAVAAHLEPEILLVDEVLAVGDTDFQKKSETKMRGVAREGRTVILVSHNMIAVSMICDRAILLRGGELAGAGPTREIISQYRASDSAHTAEVMWPTERAPANEFVRLFAVRACDGKGVPSFDLDIDKPISLEMEFEILQTTTVVPTFHVYTESGTLLFGVHDTDESKWHKMYERGRYSVGCTIPGHLLQDGEYYVTVILDKNPNVPFSPTVLVGEAVSFRVHDTGVARGGFKRDWMGAVRPILPWRHHVDVGGKWE
jgi:lipopolysaccharide transport system ATP-binding protein